MAAAFRLLARRDLSSADLASRLVAKGFSHARAEETVDSLGKSGYLDDRRFARRWAESAIRNGRGFGPRIRLELARRKVPEDIISEVLEAVATEYDELETLSSLLAKKFPDFDPLTAPDREKRRVIQYMQRRGFSMAAVFCAFRNVRE